MDREGGKTGIGLKILLLVVGMALAYFLLYPLFILGILLIILYIIFGIIKPQIRRSMTPKGMRINHRMLKGYMTEKYGEHEGKHLYKQFVDTLRRRGYY